MGLLLDAGADLEAKDGQANTALHYAAGERGSSGLMLEGVGACVAVGLHADSLVLFWWL